MSHYVYVYFGDRHPRLNSIEASWQYSLTYRELWRLYNERKNPVEAGNLFKIFYRFMENIPGRPAYPEVFDEDKGTVDWKLLGEYLLEWSLVMEAPDNVTKEEAEE